MPNQKRRRIKLYQGCSLRYRENILHKTVKTYQQYYRLFIIGLLL
jgi:hypothetical protein